MQTYIVSACVLILSLFAASCTSVPEAKSTAKLDVPPKALTPIAKIDVSFIKEPVGIIKSKQQDDLFWVISSGADRSARLYPVHKDGSPFSPPDVSNFQGVLVQGATNQDWQDISFDDQGNIVIADTGDKSNQRATRLLYIVNEPNMKGLPTKILNKIILSLPDRPKDKTPALDNYDIEATFNVRGKNYFLSKNKSDSTTKLYRLDEPSFIDINELKIIDAFDIDGLVSAATTSDDGNTLVVLTYNGIWKFDSHDGDQYFDGDISYLPIYAGKSQGICFTDSNTLMIINDEGTLFEVKTDELVQVSKKESDMSSWLSWRF